MADFGPAPKDRETGENVESRASLSKHLESQSSVSLFVIGVFTVKIKV